MAEPYAWSFQPPSAWDERIGVEDVPRDTGASAVSIRTFSYQSPDTSSRPQGILRVAVYDSATWRAISGEPGPPPGDTLATRGGYVFVAGLPPSNPFAQGSRDAQAFDSLRVSLAEARAGFRILR